MPTMRKAGPEDREFAYRVRRASLRDYVEKVEGWDESEQRRLHEARFAAQDFHIVSVAGTDVGLVAMVVTPDCVKVNQLLVLPGHQGRGIGRYCMLAVMDEARGLGLAVRLRVMKVNPRARAFYERLGFRRTGETETHDLMELT
jgi:ribosomal protein S18 acetylase RimI-like enzyme